MCGIAGYINRKSPEINTKILKSMNDTLKNRGPDDEGYFVSDFVGLAHRRLSIIDIESGKQPMTTEDGRYTIVFNGEIYNFLEIKENLQKKGISFSTRSDTEVLLKLFALKGADCLQELNGMFAFAIWDKIEKKLFVARDRLGKKPFYYALTPDYFIFGSELKALLKFPDIKKDIDADALQHFLTYEYVPAPFCIIKGIKKLKQAHGLTFNQNGDLKIHRYWTPPFGETPEVGFETAQKELFALLCKATEYRLIADVPVGVFLSGGVDSSSVVALMASLREGKDIQTFSINFEEQSYDESEFSLAVAKKFGTKHHTETLTAKKMLDIFPEVTRAMDEPFADGSILPTYLLSKFTRQNVKVALGGDGADELFAGYPTFYANRVADVFQKIPNFIKKSIEKLSKILPASDKDMSLDFKVRQFLLGAHYPGVLKNQVWLSAITPHQQNFLFSENFKRKLTAPHALKLIEDELKNCPSKKNTDELLYFYQKFYLCDDILVKVDRASMANSLEIRAPYLDVNVVEYATKLPYEFKLNGKTTKYILKKLFQHHLPKGITSRAKKGFSIPIAGWLKNELSGLLNDTLNQKRIEHDGIFNWPFIERLIKEHERAKCNHRKPLFALLTLHLWMDQYLS